MLLSLYFNHIIAKTRHLHIKQQAKNLTILAVYGPDSDSELT